MTQSDSNNPWVRHNRANMSSRSSKNRDTVLAIYVASEVHISPHGVISLASLVQLDC